MTINIYAQPTIPKEKNSSNIAANTKILLEQLYSEDIDEREEAIQALGEMRAQEALPFVMSVLHDNNSLCCARKPYNDPLDNWGVLCAQAFIKIADKQAVDLLLGMLKDKKWQARCNAAKVLGEIGDPGSIDALVTTLQDKESWEDSWVNQSVVEALGKIKDPRVADILLALLKDRKDSDVLENAAVGLVKTGDPRVTDVLLELLKKGNCVMQFSAAEAWANQGTTRCRCIDPAFKESM